MTRIAIDGPAGSGKSTVSALTASTLGLKHVDTGAMYRAVTMVALRDGVPLDDGPALASKAEAMDLRLEGSRVWIDGKDSTVDIRSEEVDSRVSQVAAHAEVRQVLVAMQRELAKEGVVMEGRDIGTVVMADADLKVYLDARPEVRAERRGVERGAGDGVAVLDGIARRDALDSRRAVSPMRPADDALIIDTSDLTPEQVVDLIVQAVRR